MKKIKVTVESTSTGFSLGAESYPVYSAGKTLPEAKVKMLEALNLYMEYNGKSNIEEAEIKWILDISSFFKYYKVINAKALSIRIGMSQSQLAQYISGIKKPSVAQKQRILKGVQQVGKELSDIQFIL